MKIITIEAARTGLLIPPDEILPLGGIHPVDLSNEIAQRYSFVSAPDFSQPLDTFQEKGMEFVMGKFHLNGEERNIGRFVILPLTGMIASASFTDTAHGFLKDILTWGAETHKFRVTSDILKRVIYLSQLVVEFNNSIDSLMAHFEIITGSFAQMFRSTYNVDLPMHCYSLMINYDRTRTTGHIDRIGAFAIERRIDEPYELNRFFCQAPLRTDDHIQLLETIESLLEAKMKT